MNEYWAFSVAGHTLAVWSIVASFTSWFPPAAAFIALVFYIIQIYESKTFQGALENRRKRKVERLRKKLKELED